MHVNIQFNDSVLKAVKDEESILIFGPDHNANLRVFEAVVLARPSNINRCVVDTQADDAVIFGNPPKPPHIKIMTMNNPQQMALGLGHFTRCDAHCISTTCLDKESLIIFITWLFSGGHGAGATAILNAPTVEDAQGLLNQWLSGQDQNFFYLLGQMVFLEVQPGQPPQILLRRPSKNSEKAGVTVFKIC